MPRKSQEPSDAEESSVDDDKAGYDPNEIVEIALEGLESTARVPLHAFESYWSQQGWTLLNE